MNKFVAAITVIASSFFMASGAYAQGDAKKGKVKANTCLGCHAIPGYRHVYPTYHVPRLAGQNAEYLVNALKAYKSGERDHETMRSQAANLSEQDMADIAAYLSQAK